jgi:hypothetical protein
MKNPSVDSSYFKHTTRALLHPHKKAVHSPSDDNKTISSSIYVKKYEKCQAFAAV